MPQTNVLPDWKATYPTDAKAQKPPIINTIGITAASWTTPNVTFTTAAPHGLAVGEAFTVAGVNPAAYNGNYTTIAGTAGSTVVAALASSPGTYVSGGTLTAEVPLQVNLAANAVPNKTVPWQGTETVVTSAGVQNVEAAAEEDAEGTSRFHAAVEGESDEDEVVEEGEEEGEEETDENGHPKPRRRTTRTTVRRTTRR